MKMEHIGIWTNDLEILKDFYKKYFDIKEGTKYRNKTTQFESYFLIFDEGCRIEIMYKPLKKKKKKTSDQYIGLSHFAISVGSRKKVIAITKELENDGYEIVSHPRTTGDGYFESVILDPDGNRVEITI